MRFILVLTLAAATSLMAAQPEMAKVDLKDANGKDVGNAKLKEGNGGVQISGMVHDMPAGVHAIHVHETGTCTAPDFKSAGGHFNPAGKKHGMQNPDGHHLGDLPNFTVGKNGRGKFNLTATGARLEGNGDTSLFKNGGTALVVHAKEDDYKTDPAGNAGDRVACGVVSK